MQKLRDDFLAISREEHVSKFAIKYGLDETERSGSSRAMVGRFNGSQVEVRERWWDPSSVYSFQRDKHEVKLFVDGVDALTVRFTGNS